MTTQRIIGGMFGLEDMTGGDVTPAPFFRKGDLLLLNARCGIQLLLQRLTPKRVWMPSYLCGAMLHPVHMARVPLHFYPIDQNLAIPSREWLQDVSRGDLVFLIDYFGFRHDASWAREVKRRGAWIVEDACQALLTEQVGATADFVLYSPRKFVGVPDGGVLAKAVDMDLGVVDLQTPPLPWWLKTLEACVLRREFDRHGGTRRWYDLFRDTEETSPVGPYAMSEVSRALLREGFHWPAIASRRRANYERLAHELGDLAVFRSLPEGVVPLGFPIRHAQRDTLRQALIDAQIYPPVHWPVPTAVPESFDQSRRLAEEIMTLPSDQRYGPDDMTRMVRAVRESTRSQA